MISVSRFARVLSPVANQSNQNGQRGAIHCSRESPTIGFAGEFSAQDLVEEGVSVDTPAR